MNIYISPTPSALGTSAAKAVSKILNNAIKEKGNARLLVSTGSSQFETLDALVKSDVDWTKVTAGTVLKIPEVVYPEPTDKAAFVIIHLSDKFLEFFGWQNLSDKFCLGKFCVTNFVRQKFLCVIAKHCHGPSVTG